MLWTPRAMPLLLEFQALVGDAVGANVVAVGAAAVLGDGERAAHPAVVAGSAHENDRVGAREDISLADRLDQQVFEHHVRSSVKINATDLAMIVGVSRNLVRVGAIVLAEPLAGGPVAVLPQDAVVNVLEELELV